ncbi:hypothetical protein OF83DRAFT_1037631, partial [Amylostereum chailletii]
LYLAAWRHGIPLVITGLEDRLQGAWTPEGFIKDYGTKMVRLVNTKTNEISEKTSTVERFFELFGNYTHPNHTDLKLKDWPPTTSFEKELPERYKILVSAVVLGHWLRPDAPLNIIAFFALNALTPDIGPKTYSALAIKEGAQHAVTYLHTDRCCAWNIMVYSELCRDGSPGKARWDIVDPKDADRLRDIALLQKWYTGQFDIIHSQDFYLSPMMVDELRAAGIRVSTIFQHVGDMVLIPAAAPHQVTNLSDATKIACDNVHPLRLHAMAKIADELRAHRLRTGEGDDVLNLPQVLWWAWV